MKTKQKVTTTFIICLGFFITIMCFGMFSSELQAKEVSVEVTPEAKLASMEIATIEEDSEFAKVELITLTEGVLASAELAVKNDEATVINETENQKQEIKAQEINDETVTSSIEDTTITTLSLSEPVVTFDKVLPRVNEYLNVRSEAAQEADVVGKLYKNSYGTILERGKEWTKIKSGDVVGYVSNDYLYFDDEAITIAKSQEAFQGVITAGTVNVRTKPSTDSEILDEAKNGDSFIHVPEMDTNEWVAILYEEGTIAYVSKDYIETKFALKTAVSKEEEEKKAAIIKAEEEEAKKAAELAKALQDAKKFQPKTTNRAAINVSDEEIYLLATVIAMEALNEPYEGKLAVANVVINRMLDGYWGNSISDVVYAKGQFSGANSGRVKQYESKVTESCKKAAIEALAGNNNIGNYMYFIMKGRANYSSYSKYYVLGNHCFYSRS